MTIDPRRQAMPLRDRSWPRSSVGRILQVSLWASAAAGISSAGVAVKEELHVGGPVNVQQFTVGLDGFVNGAVSGLTIGKNLTVPNGITPNGTTVGGQILHV